MSHLAQQAPLAEAPRAMLIYSDFSAFQALVDLDDLDRNGEDCVRDGQVGSEEELFALAEKLVREMR